MKRIKLFLFIAVALNVSFTPKTIDLTGIWQSAPMLASGWTDTYQIFCDGTFTFNYNQMLCDKRVISYNGDWNVYKKGTLMLTIKQKEIIEGGKLVPASGSCASVYEIEGGEVTKVTLDTSEIKTIKFTDYKIDKKNNRLESIKIDGVQYWKMNKDPNAY